MNTLKPVRFLDSVMDSSIEMEPFVMTNNSMDYGFLAVHRFILEPFRKGLITEVNGNFFFREGQKGLPKKIGRFITDGYDYVYQYFGRLYITNNLCGKLIIAFRFELTPEDNTTLLEVEKKYITYLDSLL